MGVFHLFSLSLQRNTVTKTHMNMNHFIGIILTLLFFFATTGRADEYTYLTVSQGEGTANFEVSQIEKFSFDQADMIVWLANGSEERLPLAGQSKMFFS